MEATQISLLIFGILLCVAIHNADGYKCYQCNSAAKYEGKRCEEPLKHQDLLKDCGTNTTHKYCRQLRQTVDGDFRIVRDCATIVRHDDLKCIQRTGTMKVKIMYCECEGEGCNSANTNFIKPLALLFTALMTVIAITSNS